MLNIIRTDRIWNAYKFPSSLIAWRDAVIAVDPDARPSLMEMARKNRHWRGKFLSGEWARTDDFLDFGGENEVQALVSCKRRLLCVRNSSPGFEAGSGYSFDGYSQSVLWPYIASEHGVAQTVSNHRMAAWNLVDYSASAAILGATTASTVNTMSLRPRSTGTMSALINTAASFSFALPEDAKTAEGFTAISTSEATVARGYKDGVRLTDATGLTITPNLLTAPLLVGGRYQNAALRSAVYSVVMCAEIGGQMTDAQELACYRGWRDLALARGVDELEA